MTGPLVPIETDSTQRYYIHMYVCAGSYTHLPSTQGTISMRTVLIHRPSDCRYALLTSPSTPDEVVVADMYDLPLAQDGWVALGRHWVFPDIDSAKAAAMLSYDSL